MVWRVFLTNIIFFEVINVDGARGRGDSKIVGGHFVQNIKAMPWIIDIKNKSHEDGHICGGSLLTPVFVLTACHCLANVSEDLSEPSLPEDKKFYSFIAGSLLSGTETENHGQIREAKDFVIHPKCVEIDEIIRYDFGIAVMKRAFIENAYVERINIISLDGKQFADRMYKMFKKKTILCYVAGWGEVRRGSLSENDRGVMSKQLKTIRMYVITEDKCRRLFDRQNDKFGNWDFKKYQQICAVAKSGWGSDCQGDSGGPFVCDGFQVGLVSTGMDCGISFPAIYAGLGLFFEWFSGDFIKEYVSPKQKQRKASEASHITVTVHPFFHVTICILLELHIILQI